jgi:5'-nucleotidase (lipoprotein e(P4) family)
MNRKHFRAIHLLLCGCVATALSACATDAGISAPHQPVAAAAVPAVLPDSVHWFRDAAEQKAIYLEVYREAAGSARSLSSGLSAGSWGVILDIDETVLDNSDYQKRQALAGQGFTADSWGAWIMERKATRLPGAKEFIDTILDGLHGRVVLVTNRKEDQCPATEDNLRSLQIRYERILCDRVGDSDKNGRFNSVIKGEPGVAAPLNVLIWIGDNIQDFPALTQQAPSDFSAFGTRYFALPNPMYGSWQKVPPR